MFRSTEELLKFQFMSMSLSYFSSLNMLGSLRDINHNTTTAAVGSSATTAATAAAAAAAANIPKMNEMKLGANALLDAAARQKQISEAEKRQKIEVSSWLSWVPSTHSVSKIPSFFSFPPLLSLLSPFSCSYPNS